jgi:hypothetical protein
VTATIHDLETFKAEKMVALHGEATFGTISIVDGHIRINVQGDYTVAAAEALARQLYVLCGQIREDGKNGR